VSEDNIAQMRETIERLSKDKAGLEKSNGELTVQLRGVTARDAFRTAGYKPENGALYAAMNPEGDITPETVVAFADEQGLPLLSAGTQTEGKSSQEGTSEAGKAQADLEGMAGGGSRAGDGGAGGAEVETLTRQAWQELYANDPASAKAAVASGRVQISKDNVYSKGALVPGVNPFVVQPNEA
jgi:hypothetical protein